MANEASNPQIVDSYDQIHQKTWARRTAGLLGGATLGGIYGAIIGIVAAFIPYIFGAIGIAGAASVGLPVIGAIATSAAIFAAIGGGAGMAIGADVGANAGSNAITTSIELERLGGDEKGRAPVIQKENATPALYVWKAAPVLIPLFAGVGALLAAIPAAGALVSMLGFASGTTAATAASATLGALMPFKNSLFHNKLTNFYYDLISDKKWAEEEAVSPLRGIAKTVEVPSVEEPQRARSFAENERRFSPMERAERGTDPDAVLSR